MFGNGCYCFAMANVQSSWDTRNWLILLISLAVCLALVSPLEHQIAHLGVIRLTDSNWLPITALIIAFLALSIYFLFALAIILSLKAKKWPLFWGVAPGLTEFCRRYLILNGGSHGHTRTALDNLGLFLHWLCASVIIAAIGCGARGMIRRRKEQRVRTGEYPAVAQPGVWPPPPSK